MDRSIFIDSSIQKTHHHKRVSSQKGLGGAKGLDIEYQIRDFVAIALITGIKELLYEKGQILPSLSRWLRVGGNRPRNSHTADE